MSVTKVTVAKLISGQADYKGNANYTAIFNVETDDPTDGIVTVGEASDPGGLTIPTPGISVYKFNAKETDLTAVCTSVTPELVDGSLTFWTVTCEYQRNTETNQDNPLLRPLLVNISSQKYEQAVIKDRNGSGIVNTAGDPFDPPLTMDATRLFLTLTKNFSAYNFDLASTLLDNVNSVPFYGMSVGTLKFEGFHATRQFEQDTEFWTCTGEFAFRREGWQLHPLNAGLRRLVSGSMQKCTDSDSLPVLAPVPLSKAGGQIAAPTVSNVVYLDIDVYPQADFTLLGFF